MRRIYFTVLLAGTLLVLAAPLKSQVHFNVNLNIGSQPVWGPVGYDEVQYYYLPDIDSYYYVPQHRFYYNDGGRWIYSSSLPTRYRTYDLYNSYKVVVNEREPWRHHETYREKYSSYKGRHDQQIIRDSHDEKYFVNKNHPEHGKWIKEQKHDNGNNKEQRRDNKNEKNDRQDNKDGHGKHKK